jgi:putative ABC transport system substrate-binding protein
VMDRRIFLGSLGVVALGVVGGPLPVETQQKVPKATIGILEPAPRPAYVDAFRQGLRDLGYVEGQNIVVVVRTAHTADAQANPALLAEQLVALKMDVIVTWSTPAVLAARRADGSLPIVSVTGDPVLTGLASSLARPGGTVTGLAILTSDLELKKLELLKEAVPRLSRIGVLVNPDNRAWSNVLDDLHKASPAFSVKLLGLDARNASDIDTAFAHAERHRVGGLIVVTDAIFNTHAPRIAQLAARHRLAVISGSRDITAAGALMSYGVLFPDMMRRAAAYVDKILRGAKAADLPIEQATRFDMVVNRRAAKVLGLTIPPSLLLRADQVIE